MPTGRDSVRLATHRSIHLPLACASFPPAGSSLKADWQATSPDHSPFMCWAKDTGRIGWCQHCPNMQPRVGSRSPRVVGTAPDRGWNQADVPSISCRRGADRVVLELGHATGAVPRNHGCWPLHPSLGGWTSLGWMCAPSITLVDRIGLRYPNQSETLYLQNLIEYDRTFTKAISAVGSLN